MEAPAPAPRRVCLSAGLHKEYGSSVEEWLRME